jgi:hypothetical protein
VQKDLDIQEYTDPVHDTMVPHTLVLAPELRVHGIYNGYWYWGRPSVEELRRDLREVTRRIRPDWDLSLRSRCMARPRAGLLRSIRRSEGSRVNGSGRSASCANRYPRCARVA